jgi:hypothetical protein
MVEFVFIGVTLERFFRKAMRQGLREVQREAGTRH